VSSDAGDGLVFDSSSYDDGAAEMDLATSHLDGAAEESAAVQGQAGAQLRQWLPTVPAADTLDEVEGTADQALSEATEVTGQDSGKLLAAKQNMLDTEARNTAAAEQIRSDAALSGMGSDADTPGEVGQTPRGALSGQEQDLLNQRREDLAASNPSDYEDFSKDPDHFSKKAGYKVTDAAQQEAKTALDLRDQGKLPADIQRPTGRGEGDFYSPGSKQYYDIKEVNDTPPHEFSASGTESSIQRQLLIGRTPIIDTREASQSAIDQVVEVIERNGWEGRVIWYP
jgi:hypothetical protein